MKIQERTGAAHGRGASAPAHGTGERLPSAPRERKPALAALAVLLILIGALGATVLVLRAGDRIEVVKITQDVQAGKKIPAGAMESVLVAEDSGVDYVKWDQRELISGKYWTTTDIKGGSLLVGQMLTDDSGTVPQGKVLVGLSLKRGQYPSDLAPGDVVTLFPVADNDNRGDASSGDGKGGTGGTSGTPLVARAKVYKTESSDGQFSSGDFPVSVLVDQAQAANVIRYAAAGEVAVAKVPKAEG